MEEIAVKVLPGSSRQEITLIGPKTYKVKVRAVPEKGKANKEMILLIAKKFSVSKNSVRIISGQRSKTKRVQILK